MVAAFPGDLSFSAPGGSEEKWLEGGPLGKLQLGPREREREGFLFSGEIRWQKRVFKKLELKDVS